MAEASDESGLSAYLGEQLKAFDALPIELTVFIICIISTVMTNIASNTSTASILMPVLKQLVSILKVPYEASVLIINSTASLLCTYLRVQNTGNLAETLVCKSK